MFVITFKSCKVSVRSIYNLCPCSMLFRLYSKLAKDWKHKQYWHKVQCAIGNNSEHLVQYQIYKLHPSDHNYFQTNQGAMVLQKSMLKIENIMMTTFNVTFHLLEMEVIYAGNTLVVRKCSHLENQRLVI